MNITITDVKNDMIILTDTFNDVEISKHRTLEAAVKKQMAHLRAVKKANGESSYLTYGYTDTTGDEISSQEIYAAENSIINS
jgi:hypothetical protein